MICVGTVELGQVVMWWNQVVIMEYSYTGEV